MLFTHFPVTTRDPSGEGTQLGTLGHVTQGCARVLCDWELPQTCAGVGGHALWAEAVVQVKEAGRRVLRAQLPGVRHGEMLG